MKSDVCKICHNNRPRSKTALLAVHGSRVSDYTRDRVLWLMMSLSGLILLMGSYSRTLFIVTRGRVSKTLIS